MKVLDADIPGVRIVEPVVHRDARGFFLETYQRERYAAAGIADAFVQDNHSRSARGTLRGLHLQGSRPQAKLVRVVEGSVFAVAVDLRVGSPNFKRWTGVELSAANFRQLYLPAGMAFGFCATSDAAQLEYKCSEFYDLKDEFVISWSDPELAIRWPVKDPLLSDRDGRGKTVRELLDALPRWKGR